MKGLKWGDRTRISYGKFTTNSQMQQTTDVEFR